MGILVEHLFFGMTLADLGASFAIGWWIPDFAFNIWFLNDHVMFARSEVRAGAAASGR